MIKFNKEALDIAIKRGIEEDSKVIPDYVQPVYNLIFKNFVLSRGKPFRVHSLLFTVLRDYPIPSITLRNIDGVVIDPKVFKLTEHTVVTAHLDTGVS